MDAFLHLTQYIHWPIRPIVYFVCHELELLSQVFIQKPVHYNLEALSVLFREIDSRKIPLYDFSSRNGWTPAFVCPPVFHDPLEEGHAVLVGKVVERDAGVYDRFQFSGIYDFRDETQFFMCTHESLLRSVLSN